VDCGVLGNLEVASVMQKSAQHCDRQQAVHTKGYTEAGCGLGRVSSPQYSRHRAYINKTSSFIIMSTSRQTCLLFVYFSYFEKIKVDLRNHLAFQQLLNA
jgi:hypothetical protein